jgi:hypothetical protein
MFDPAASYKIINSKSISALSIKDAGSFNGARAILFSSLKRRTNSGTSLISATVFTKL